MKTISNISHKLLMLNATKDMYVISTAMVKAAGGIIYEKE